MWACSKKLCVKIASLIDGVTVTSLAPKSDGRGVFTEVFRAEWPTQIAPIQWNVVTNAANVLRGFHVHASHVDYLTVLDGELLLGLRDIRPESPTHGRAEMLSLNVEAAVAITTPPGVAHGFYFPRPSRVLCSVSHYWNIADELGCRWDDPEIGIRWPTSSPVLSERDQSAGSFREMVAQFLRGRGEMM